MNFGRYTSDIKNMYSIAKTNNGFIEHHVSMINNIYGSNHILGNKSIHSEIDAIEKYISKLIRINPNYKPNDIRRKMKNITIINIRTNNGLILKTKTNNNNNFQCKNSAPCSCCILKLKMWCVKGNYLYNGFRDSRIQKNFTNR